MSLGPGSPIEKDPDAIADPRGFNWTGYLSNLDLANPGAAVTIVNSTYFETPTGSLTLTDPNIVAGNLKTTIKLTGGQVGMTYTLTNRILTSLGNTEDCSVQVIIKNK